MSDDDQFTLAPRARSTAAHRRPQVPSLVAAFLIGALVAGGLAPLVGRDRDTSVASEAPGFLNGDNGAATAGDTRTSAARGGAIDADGVGDASDRSGGQGGSRAAGPEQAGPSDEVPSGTGPPTGGAARTASDVGVTATTIRVGSFTMNCKGCAAIGATTDPTPHRDIAAAFVDDINARGGINGRKLELFTADHDPVEDALSGGGTQREACIELTEHRKVFAVMVGAAGPCVYEEHKTLMIAQDTHGGDEGSFGRSEGRIWTFSPTNERAVLDWAVQIGRQKLFPTSTKFGIVVVDDPTKRHVDQLLIPALKRHDYTPTHVSVLPSDPSTLPVKTATEVGEMRRKGVTDVLLAATPYVVGEGWVREAERNGWKPQYYVSDFYGAATEHSGDQMSRAADWRGAIALSTERPYTVAELRRDAASKRCLDIWERAAGRPTTELLAPFVLLYCNAYHVFELATTRAGSNPTRSSLSHALGTLGPFPFAGAVADVGSFGGAYSHGPVKWSASDNGQRKVYTKPCPRAEDEDEGCYVASGPVYRLAA